MKSPHDYRGAVRAARKRWLRLSRRWNDPLKPADWYGQVFRLEMEWRNRCYELATAPKSREP
jgi:hypothetical protein